MISADKHVFAIYTPDLFDQNCTMGTLKKINDEQIVHRLIKVLRTEIGQQIIFFDHFYHARVEIEDISKKFFSVKFLTFEKNPQQSQEIIFLLPLLKKEALEEAVYSLSEIGVSQIQLVITEKSRQKLLHEKEFARLESIIIAAAEQSKNYNFPKIYPPVALSKINFDRKEIKIVFDPQGQSYFDLKAKNLTQDKIFLFVGPEGGLSQEELQQLENYSFLKCRLTPTILRAVQAIALGAALFKI